MELINNREGNTLTIQIVGRLNTGTAPELDKNLASSLDGVSHLVLDLKGLDYISSAGLRVILSAQKTMTRKKGTLVVRDIKPEVYDVFEMTGFVDFLTIE